MGLVSKLKKLPVLQVALDVTRVEDAVRVASAVYGVSDRIVFEVGTPLVKSEGVKAISIIKGLVGDAPVIADTKSVDVVGLEAELAASAGADAYTVMGFVDDEVVREAIEAGKRYGVDVVFDLMYLRDYVEASRRLHGLGAKIVELHVGVDVQRRLGVTAEALADTVSVIVKSIPDLIVAVAGGVNAERARKLAAAGAHIIVVGSAIVRASDPRKAAKQIVEAMGEG